MAVNVIGLIGIIVFYVLIVIGGCILNVRAERKKKKSSSNDDAMLAGRSIGLFAGAFTMTATWVGGGYITGTVEGIYSSGAVWALAPWGFSLSLALGGYFFANKMRSQNYTTMIDPFQHKYGQKIGGLLIIPALLAELFWSASTVASLGTAISIVLETDKKLSILIVTIIGIFYALIGGMSLVTYTDIIQLTCLFITVWIAFPFMLANEKVDNISYKSSNWSGIKEFELKMIPLWFDEAIYLVLGGIPWQAYFQKVLSCKSISYATKLSYLSALGCLLMSIPPFIMGAISKTTRWNEINLPAQDSINGDPVTLKILPILFIYLLPSALTFICLGTVAASSLSSMDSSILGCSTMLTHNIYGEILRKNIATPKELLWVFRIGIFIMGTIAGTIAAFSESVYSLWAFSSDLAFVLLLPRLIMVIYCPYSNAIGSLAGLLSSILLRCLFGAPGVFESFKATISLPPYGADGTSYFPTRVCSACIGLLIDFLICYLIDKYGAKLSERFQKKKSTSYILPQKITIKPQQESIDEII